MEENMEENNLDAKNRIALSNIQYTKKITQSVCLDSDIFNYVSKNPFLYKYVDVQYMLHLRRFLLWDKYYKNKPSFWSLMNLAKDMTWQKNKLFMIAHLKEENHILQSVPVDLIRYIISFLKIDNTAHYLFRYV